MLAASLQRSKHGLGPQNAPFQKRHIFFQNQKSIAASLKRSKHGLRLPIQIKKPLILIDIDYQELVLNKLFIRVYYIEFPIEYAVFFS